MPSTSTLISNPYKAIRDGVLNFLPYGLTNSKSVFQNNAPATLNTNTGKYTWNEVFLAAIFDTDRFSSLSVVKDIGPN